MFVACQPGCSGPAVAGPPILFVCARRLRLRLSREENRMPDVVPFLGYEDPGAAADWLCQNFGFEELERIDYEGSIGHVTLRSGDGLVFLGSPEGYINPRHLQEQLPVVAKMYSVPWVVDGVWASVDNLDQVIDA